MNKNEQHSSLQARFAEIFVHLRDQDIEQFYAQYQLWVMRHRIPILENEIETLRGDIAENQQRIQSLRPSALAQAVLARLQAQGVNDVALLDQLLERGEDWLDRMMQRLDYCEQVGDFIQGDYTQWCINSLEGAYDWIDTARGDEREGVELLATLEVSTAEAQITAELLLSKLRGEEDDTSDDATHKQPALADTPHIADQFDVEGNVEENQLANVEGSVELVKKPTCEQALEILGIENASSTDESETSAHTPEPEVEAAALTEQEEEEQSAPWYSADLEQLEPFELAHSQGMDDWIKMLQAETSVSPTTQPVEIGDELAETAQTQEEHAPVTGETSDQPPDESVLELTEMVSPEPEQTAAQETEQIAGPELVNENGEMESSSTSAEDSEQIAQVAAEVPAASSMAEQDVLVPENAPEEDLHAEEYGTALFEPIENPLPWYEYLVLGEMSKDKQALAPEPVEEQIQEVALDETRPFELNKIHATPQPETPASSLEQASASPPDLQDALAEESAAVIEQAPESTERVEYKATEITQEVHTAEGESSYETQTEHTGTEPEVEVSNHEELTTDHHTDSPAPEDESVESVFPGSSAPLNEISVEELEETARIPIPSIDTAASQVEAASSIETEESSQFDTDTLSGSTQNAQEAIKNETAEGCSASTEERDYAGQLSTLALEQSEKQTAVEEQPEGGLAEASQEMVESAQALETSEIVEPAQAQGEVLAPELVTDVQEEETVSASALEAQTIVEPEPVPEQPKKRGFWRRLFGWGRKK